MSWIDGMDYDVLRLKAEDYDRILRTPITISGICLKCGCMQPLTPMGKGFWCPECQTNVAVFIPRDYSEVHRKSAEELMRENGICKVQSKNPSE